MAVAETEAELKGYEVGTGEYEITHVELKRLVKYSERLIPTVEVE